MNQADNYYPGSIREGVDSGYFANIYDYREYAPNYFFFVFDHDDDPNLYDQVFLEDDLVPTFLQFNSRILPAYGTVGIRGDWLDEQGIKLDDIDTVDDYTMLGELFKVQYGCEMAVDLVTNQIDMPMFFTCYDTTPASPPATTTPSPAPTLPTARSTSIIRTTTRRTLCSRWSSGWRPASSTRTSWPPTTARTPAGPKNAAFTA
jgi:hypothetical protein